MEASSRLASWTLTWFHPRLVKAPPFLKTRHPGLPYAFCHTLRLLYLADSRSHLTPAKAGVHISHRLPALLWVLITLVVEVQGYLRIQADAKVIVHDALLCVILSAKRVSDH